MSDSGRSDISDLSCMQQAARLARERQELDQAVADSEYGEQFQVVGRRMRAEPRTSDMVRAEREGIVIRESENMRDLRRWVETHGDNTSADPVSIISRITMVKTLSYFNIPS